MISVHPLHMQVILKKDYEYHYTGDQVILKKDYEFIIQVISVHPLHMQVILKKDYEYHYTGDISTSPTHAGDTEERL